MAIAAKQKIGLSIFMSVKNKYPAAFATIIQTEKCRGQLHAQGREM
jgi:hypothetical protein